MDIVLQSNNAALERAWRVALGDLYGNIQPYQGHGGGQFRVLFAGLDYDRPWTRDAAINTWFGLPLLAPEVARSTLLSVLNGPAIEPPIGGQYWDAMIWAVGAWQYYLMTGDAAFLRTAFDASRRSLAYFETEEFDADRGLFRGPAVYGDGVAAYPDRYANPATSSILDWPKNHSAIAAPRGYGLPMHALSTNLIYQRAFALLPQMAQALGEAVDDRWAERAVTLHGAIQQHFWKPERGLYDYLVDDWGGCNRQEGLGHAFALLFGLADAQESAQILNNLHIEPAGIPCVYPNYERYDDYGIGRHSGTVWPFIQAFWGMAAALHGRPDLLHNELRLLLKHINRDHQCAEIYHPITGAVYGGVQEAGSGELAMDWDSCARQSWSATGLMALVLQGVVGMRFNPEGLRFAPNMPDDVDFLQITGIRYRAATLDIIIEGHGSVLQSCTIDGALGDRLSANAGGNITIKMAMQPTS